MQVLSIAGALAILGAFAGAQIRALTPDRLLYNVLNFVGGAVLAWVAFIGSEYGFLLLEGTWALIGLWALIRLARDRGFGAGRGRSEAPS